MVCLKCFNQPGSTYTHQGIPYIKLAPDDPYYSMTMRHFGYYGAGWTSVGRYMLAQKLSRCLEEDEYVGRRHHNPMDNRPENLYLRKRRMPRSKEVNE